MLKENLTNRKQQYQQALGMLALEERSIRKRLEEVLSSGAGYEGAINEIDNVLRDMETEAAIDAAKER